MNVEEKEESLDLDAASTISLSASIRDTSSLSPQSAQSTPSSTATFTMDDPSTTQVLVQPVKPPRKSKKAPGTKLGTCPYQAPCSYEAWAGPEEGGSLPGLGYDNVPTSMLVYDNAPPTGTKRWEHPCCSSEGTVMDKCESQPLTDSGYDNLVEEKDSCSILEETIEFITKSCSDLEDSVSETPIPKSPGRVKFADNVEANSDGFKAPLALPEPMEDLGGSTTEGEALDASSSDQQTPGSEDYNGVESTTRWILPEDLFVDEESPDEPPPSVWASESKIYQKIYAQDEVSACTKHGWINTV